MNKLRLTGLLLTRLLGLLLMCVSCVQVGYAQQSGGGNYPTGNGVRVREVDGSPNVPGTQTLVFPNGSLTRAGQTVTVTFASSGSFSTPVIITSTSNPCFAVGPNGSTNPVLSADCSVASQADGAKVTGYASGAGANISTGNTGSGKANSFFGGYSAGGGTAYLSQNVFYNGAWTRGDTGVALTSTLLQQIGNFYFFTGTTGLGTEKFRIENAGNVVLPSGGIMGLGGSPLSSDARATLQLYNSSDSGFTLSIMKTGTDNADLNVDGAVNVKHGQGYSLTPGYAHTYQVYAEAKMNGLILGNNSFVGATVPYVPTTSDVPNGYIRFELGPLWPYSEKMRLNNRGDLVVGWTLGTKYTASQSGTTITSTVGSFSAADVGKWFLWGDYENGGTQSFADKITAYTDSTHVTVETSRTIASQAGSTRIPNTLIPYTGGIKFGASGTLTGGTNILELSNGTSGQNLNIYNTTNGTDKEFVSVGYESNVAYLQSKNAASGTTRSLYVGTATGSGSTGLMTQGNARLIVDSAGRVYGTALHNNGSAPTGAANGYIASGTYTPTRSAEANLDSNVTMTVAQWVRVGNVVTVSGGFTADPTTTTTATSFEITLPLASNLAAISDAAGAAFSGAIAGQGAEVVGVAANDTAKIQWIAVDVTSKTWSYTFTYVVL